MKKLSITTRYLLILLASFAGSLHAQVANDQCSGAITLVAAADTSCNPVSGTFAGSVNENPPDSCAQEISPEAYDNWYKFVATSTSHMVDVTTTSGGFQGTGAVVIVYDACGGNKIACGNPQIFRFGQFVIVQSGLTRATAAGLTIGNTYYVRVYNYGDTLPAPGDDAFTICVRSTPAPPANDLCSTAQNLSVADTCIETPGTLDGAAEEYTIYGCGTDAPSQTAYDVWYSFTAADATEIISVTPLAQGQDGVAPVIELYNACGGTQLDCKNPVIFQNVGISGTNTMTVSGLNPGTQYFIRVFHYGDQPAVDGRFTVCVYNAPPPPPNDGCADAALLTVADTCNPTAGTVASAQEESGPVSCGADDPSTTAYDIWYKFQAAQSEQFIEASTVTQQNGVAAVIELYDNCGGTMIACANPQIFPGFGAIPGTTTLNATGLTPGTTYYFRVYHYGDDYPAAPELTVCVYNPPPPPANDTCEGAITLQVNPNCVPTMGTLNNSNEEMPAIDCGGNTSAAAFDVWYSFVANNSSQMVDVRSQNVDAVISVYSVCGGPVLSCENPDGSGLTSLQANGLIAGNTYYVRVYHDGPPVANGNFAICVYDLPPAEPNDECDDAVLISQAGSRAECNPTPVSTINATASPQATICGVNAVDDDVWYRFTALTAEVVVAAGNKSQSLQATPIGFTMYQGSCSGQQSLECSNGAPGDSLVFRNLIPGNTYFIRTFTRGTQARGTYDLCVYTHVAGPRPVNDTCGGALVVIPTNTDTCVAPQNGSLTNATEENPVDSCNGAPGSATAFDVWYKFTAITDAHDILVRSTQVAAVVAIYEAAGNTCGDFIACENPRLINVQGNTFGVPGQTRLKALGLTVGTTYFVRVFHYGNTLPAPSGFTICIYRDSAATIGMEDHLISSTLDIYPNPVEEEVHVSFSAQSEITLILRNMNGQVVRKEELGRVIGRTEKPLSLADLPKGVYTLQVAGETENIVRKIIRK